MRTPHKALGLGIVLAGLGLVIAGCSDPASPEGDLGGDLSAADADVIALTFEDDIDISIGALFHGGTINAHSSSAPVYLGPPVGPRMPIIDCLVIEPFPPEDPDADGVPTRLSLSFDPDPCTIRHGGVALQFSGSVKVGDPVPNVAGYDLEEVIDNFSHAFVLPNGRAFRFVRNGTRSVRHDDNLLNARERLGSTHINPGGVAHHAGADWELQFRGDQSIEFQQPIPSGHLAIEGTWLFAMGRPGTDAASDRGRRSRMFNVTTTTPLAYDASCTDARPLLRFTEGQIHKTLIHNGEPRAVIVITWTGCGETPTREVIRRDSDRPGPGPHGPGR